jgi:prolyl 4-hydroxylase
MKEYIHNNQDNFIAGWYIDPLLCNRIVKKSEDDITKFVSWAPEYQHCDLQEFDTDMCIDYHNMLHNVIELYKAKYPFCYRELQPWGRTPPRIQRYNPGQSYSKPHCENSGSSGDTYRHMAYMTYLNDITTGGGTEFLNQQTITPASVGLTLIWPAHWTHYHRGIVAPTEVKYIITGWLCFM